MKAKDTVNRTTETDMLIDAERVFLEGSFSVCLAGHVMLPVKFHRGGDQFKVDVVSGPPSQPH
jgi:hypothetical protein